MENRILILGKGFIGEKLQETLNCKILAGRILSFKDAQDIVKKHKPKIIINCIGHIGRNVDDCEKDLDKTLIANTFVPIMLSEVAIRNKIKLIHISSGCIYKFDYRKDKPIKEENLPDFFDLFYSRSKIYAERALEVLCHKFNFLIVKPRVPLDNRPHLRNLLTKLINYKKVIDIPNSITYIPDFINALKHLIKINARGIYNVVNKGTLRYPELLDIYKRYVPEFEYEIIDYKELNLTRTNIILSTQKLERTGFKIRDIHEVLKECVKSYLKY